MEHNLTVQPESQSTGMQLLKKGQKGLIHALFSRLGLFIVLLVFQALLLFGIWVWFQKFIPHILGGAAVFTVLIVLVLLNTEADATAKITWLIVIMLFPFFGAMFYWYVQSDVGHRAIKDRSAQLIAMSRDKIAGQEETMEALKKVDSGAAALANYMARSNCHPVYANTEVTYFPIGEKKWEEMLRQLEQAKEFIYLEYFIVDEGLMWGKILEILARKAKEGVDVRVMYDGTCEFTTLPHDYPKRLRKLGIHCKMFAPIVPFLSTHYNYRDHRKILVIDNRVAFNGGVNLADEYINHIEKFGHWKDCAIMLKGEAVKSFTLMFLQMWNISEKSVDFDLERGMPTSVPEAEGFVIPYGDCPLDNDKLGERVYMDILNRARSYVHIMSPYLILDGELETALRFAAERGVDVKLILPGVPDKKGPYALAKTHYKGLLSSGVEVYEYTPGFVHSKMFVSDDREGVVGTINLDYRSLYHHFECATYLYGVPCLRDMEADFQETLAKCRRVTEETIRKEKLGMKLTGIFLKSIAPLM